MFYIYDALIHRVEETNVPTTVCTIGNVSPQGAVLASLNQRTISPDDIAFIFLAATAGPLSKCLSWNILANLQTLILQT